jgi:CheY-like chemotaxis protein
VAAPKKVLVVDDDPDNLKMVSRFLSSHGFAVVTTASPFGVNTLITEEQPSVVVLDVMMPALSGETVARFIANRLAAERVPIIFFSAVDDSILAEIVDRVPEARAVSKIAGLAALQKTIEAALDGR